MDTSSKILTIIICTYNRNHILNHCLNSFRAQTVDSSQYDILVVNNYSDQKVYEEIVSMASRHKNVQVKNEPQPGLSRARNFGAQLAQKPWVGYIDDDCRIMPNFVEEALRVIDEGKYDCFGGAINSWWLYERPRWMSEDYGTKPILSNKDIVLKENFNWGGNIFFNRYLLLEVGGFDENIGMHEMSIGYSAENRVQVKLRENGAIIGYIPSIVVEHLVSPHKFKLTWHLKAAFAEGRDALPVFPEQYKSKALLKDFLRIPLNTFQSIHQWMFRSEYYFENAILDTLKPAFRLVGKLFICVKSKLRKGVV